MGEGGSIILTGSSAGARAPGNERLQREQGGSAQPGADLGGGPEGTGIRVNVLSPGAAATDLAKAALGEEGVKAFGAMTALQRMADPAELGGRLPFSRRRTAAS